MSNILTSYVLTIAVLALTAMLVVGLSPAFAQNTHDEEYKSQHDGGDRAEYEQELAHSDPWFYVPPSK